MPKPPVGRDYYAKQGLRPITIYIYERTHAGLMKQAAEEEQSLQVVARRALEAHVTKKAKRQTRKV